MHTAIDTFKLVTLPPGATVGFSLALAAVSATAPLLALALPRHNPVGVGARRGDGADPEGVEPSA